MMRIRSSKKGFTLVEIMIVVAIIGIIIAIAVPAMIGARTRARAKNCQENQTKMFAAVQEWALETNAADDATPGSIDDLVGPTLYLQKTPQCPDGPTAIAIPAANAFPVCPNTIAEHLVDNT